VRGIGTEGGGYEGVDGACGASVYGEICGGLVMVCIVVRRRTSGRL
jgi:hypothetical protein